MAPALGYWAIRGLAQPIRLLLTYTGTEFEDVKYQCGDAPDYDKSSWFNIKHTLGLPFPNLPYYIDGDIKVTQSTAKVMTGTKFYMTGTKCLTEEEASVCPYFASKDLLKVSKPRPEGYKAHCTQAQFVGIVYNNTTWASTHLSLIQGLMAGGATESEMAAVDMLDCVAMDFRNGFVRLCYDPDCKSKEEAYRVKVHDTIKGFSDYLGTKKFFVGDNLTYVDFLFYELLDQHLLWDSSVIEPHKNIKEFLARIEALPAISEYMKSDKFMKRPINNTMAVFK